VTIANPQIPASREAFIDPRTGMVSRSWYLFLQNLITLVDPNVVPSADDLAVEQAFDSDNTSQVSELQKEIDRLGGQESDDIWAATGTVRYVNATAPTGVLTVGGVPYQNSGTVAFAWSGTSGGVPYFSGTATMASSGALTATAIVVGGGAGSAPYTSAVKYIASGALEYPSISAPATPAAGFARMYAFTSQGHTQFHELDEDGHDFILTRDNVFMVRNTSGSAMAKGAVVNVYDSTGQVPEVRLSDATDSNKKAAGILMEALANNAFGLCMVLGEVTGLNTAAYADGDEIYTSTTPGTYTDTAPAFPTALYQQRIGTVLYAHATQGIIMVQLQSIKTLVDLTTDVSGILPASKGGTGVSNNDSSTVTITGAFATTFTVTGATGVTLPTTGTLATLAGTEALTNKTLTSPAINGTVTTTGLTFPVCVISSGYTVATLPAGTVGMRAYVTDALLPTYNGALTGGGAVTVPVFYNGAAWVSA